MYNFTMVLKVLSTKTANVKSIKTIKLYIFNTHSTKCTNYRSHCSDHLHCTYYNITISI